MVISTIAENLKSFFQKEEQLEKSPKKLSDAAIEVFEKPRQNHTIVSNTLKTQPNKLVVPNQAPKLPFSSAQLRQTLTQAPTTQPTTSTPQNYAIPPKNEVSSTEIEQQIKEFEQHISALPGEDGSTVPISTSSKPVENEDSLFHNFSSYLRNQGYQFQDDEIPADFISRMKTHHEERLSKKRHDKQADTLEHEISQKLTQLQTLETDWVHKKEEVTVAQERMLEIEEEISTKTEQLRELISQMRSHLAVTPLPEFPKSQMSDRLEPNQYFRLADGRMVSSLSELQSHLKVMDDTTFYRHVTPERNDFASWIELVFNDKELASKVAQVRTKYELARLLDTI